MSDLRVGDIVILKSGGPAMTIEAVDETGLTCYWFDGAERRTAFFPPETIYKP